MKLTEGEVLDCETRKALCCHCFFVKVEENFHQEKSHRERLQRNTNNVIIRIKESKKQNKITTDNERIPKNMPQKKL